LLISQIESENLQWSKGWHAVNSCPNNARTGREYNGTNFFILYFTALKKGYTDPRWLTFNQAQELGASVKKGEKSTRIFHWSEYDLRTKKAPDWSEIKKLPTDEYKKYCDDNIRFSVKYYNVFNAQQCANLPKFEPVQMSDEERAKQSELIETVIGNSAAPVIYGGGQAYYNFEKDEIHLPNISDFKSMQDYYATALHEIAHSTGHSTRLSRKQEGEFGSEDYAAEASDGEEYDQYVDGTYTETDEQEIPGQDRRTEQAAQDYADNGVRHEDFYCDKCGEPIARRVWHYSMEKFERPLCYTCQRAVRNGQRGGTR